MKLHLLDKGNSLNSSFKIALNRYPNFLKLWHHHSALELVLIQKSTGTRFVGDNIEKFEEGEVILIGKDLPHMWLNEEIYFEGRTDIIAEAIVLHFTEDFLGSGFLEAPEMQTIKKLFSRAEQGIMFMGLDSLILDQIKNLFTVEGIERILQFIKILDRLSRHKDYKMLSSAGFMNSYKKTNNEELNHIYAYIFKNFSGPIRLKDVAEVAHMNPSAFSRFFKRLNRKTFSKYVNEIRIGYACKLLIERKSSIVSVCYESGYNNISNFNRQFKTIVGMSPSEYIHFHK
jgi:AraC-like DNA-binding protein